MRNDESRRGTFFGHATGHWSRVLRNPAGTYSSNPSRAVRSDRIHAVFGGMPRHGPDESGHDERVGRRALFLDVRSAGEPIGIDLLIESLGARSRLRRLESGGLGVVGCHVTAAGNHRADAEGQQQRQQPPRTARTSRIAGHFVTPIAVSYEDVFQLSFGVRVRRGGYGSDRSNAHQSSNVLTGFGLAGRNHELSHGFFSGFG